MKTTRDKHVVMAADFAGYPLKEAVKQHLVNKGWTVEDLTPDQETTPMYHRAGFMLGARIAEKEYEKGLLFCGTGMGIHLAAAKVPHVHAAVCESVRNLACVGAWPLALTDCLNYGNPEKPRPFGDFASGVAAIGDACRGIGRMAEDDQAAQTAHPIPVISGNVSFYNQSSGGNAILPSPIVCCVGRVPDVTRHATSGVEAPGQLLFLVGQRRDRHQPVLCW